MWVRVCLCSRIFTSLSSSIIEWSFSPSTLLPPPSSILTLSSFTVAVTVTVNTITSKAVAVMVVNVIATIINHINRVLLIVKENIGLFLRY